MSGSGTEFKFVIKLLDPKVLEAANIDGQRMIASKGFGVAYFKDGRVAINDFIITYDLLKGSGPSRGYSTRADRAATYEAQWPDLLAPGSTRIGLLIAVG